MPCRVHRTLRRLHEGFDQTLTVGAWELPPALATLLAAPAHELDGRERMALHDVPFWLLRYGVGRHAETSDTLGRRMLWSVFDQDVVACGPGGGSLASTSHAQAF